MGHPLNVVLIKTSLIFANRSKHSNFNFKILTLTSKNCNNKFKIKPRMTAQTLRAFQTHILNLTRTIFMLCRRNSTREPQTKMGILQMKNMKVELMTNTCRSITRSQMIKLIIKKTNRPNMIPVFIIIIRQHFLLQKK